jgi:hypothetical protein
LALWKSSVIDLASRKSVEARILKIRASHQETNKLAL